MEPLDDSKGENLYRFRTGALEYDPSRGEVRVEGEPVQLEPKPLALLQALIEQPGQVASRHELMQRLWGRHEHLSDNVLANAVMRLRRALGPTYGALVRNVAGQGYMLDAKVERVAIGRVFESRFALQAGLPVPGRDGYQLDAPLGSSPHSEVWLASHGKTHDRRVFKFCSDGDRLAALKREFTLYRVLREALGEREDFARVLDANFGQPPFWLECEYGGESLVQWAAPGRLAEMALDERLALFVSIARAVADAHGVGVLHKDLKPANVLVQAAPATPGAVPGAPAPPPRRWIARITDFGSGRLLSPEVLQRLGVTQLGLTMTAASSDTASGTLMYLAPELFGGASPTVQSDLYALGLMLYQMAVGDMRRPMATGWELQIEDDLLRQDIAAATQGRPDERLTSVAALVDRLESRDERKAQARLAAEQRAAAEAAQEEVKRIRARRPWLLALTAALVTGLGVASWAWLDATRQRELARLAGERAEAIHAFLNDDVLGGANPFAARTTEPLTVKSALLAAADRVDLRFAAHPELRGAVHVAMAELLQNYQELGAANGQWAKALADLRRVHGDGDARTVEASYRTAMGLSRSGDTRAAAALLAEADQAFGKLPAPQASLVVIRSYAHGSQMINESRAADAVPFMQQAVAAATASDTVPHTLRDASFEQLAGAYYVAGMYKEGIALVEGWIRTLESRPEAPALMLASARQRLGSLLANDERAAEAMPLLEQAVAAFETGLGPTALTTLLARDSLCATFALAQSMEQAQRCREALIRAADGAKDMQPRVVAGMRLNMGIGYFMMARDAEALQWLEEAEARLRHMAGGESYLQVASYYAACAQMRLGRTDAALARLDTLRADALQLAEPTAPWHLRLQLLRGVGLARRGDAVQARGLLEAGIAEMSGWATGQTESVFSMAKASLDQLDHGTARR